MNSTYFIGLQFLAACSSSSKRLLLDEIADDFANYLCRMDDYFVIHRLVKTRIFGNRTVHAYVTLS